MPVSVQQLRNARTVTLPNGERFEFAWVEPDAAARLTKLGNEPVSARKYMITVLSTLLRAPTFAEEELSSWPDERLQALTVGYLNLPANKGRRDDQAVVAVTAMAECRQALQATLEADIQRLNESARQVMDSLTKNAWKFGLATPPITSPLLELMRSSPLLQFEQMGQARVAMIEQLTGGFAAQLQQSVDRLIEQQTLLSQSLQQMIVPSIRTDLLLGQLDFGRFVPVLDSWSLIQRWGILETLDQVRADRRAALLLEADLEFLNDLVDEAIDEAIDDAAFTDQQHRRTYVGRLLRDETASEAFWHQLELALTDSPRARRRLAIVRAAHRAHRARQYELSVPTLYAQVEGLLADCLCEAGEIRWSRKRRHWIVIDPLTGKDRMVKRKGEDQPDTVGGLERLTAIARGQKSVAATRTVTQLREGIASTRNQVMHGTKTNYATARNSSRLLLIALILAQQLRQFENR